MILMETKIFTQAYCRNRLGYYVECLLMITMATDGAQEGVVLVIWDRTQGWILELTRLHGPNMVRCEVVTDGKKDHDHWRIPPSLHPVALTGLGGGPGTLTGPRYHSVRVCTMLDDVAR